ncbi:Peroxisomal coenzyme A diphosphatase nudt7 [Desmophyllum pertusum]|uniref:Peroxisomal coenzyme A diphosphatase nudt7 n=1 Tax=Desmophyllum pertusum TaxID=174260 RepID=A0A9W9Z4K9_9CNID|nr:Peroxisomal coenzyme A diphosphatase nudt7 [Desmophyllum pertusum]
MASPSEQVSFARAVPQQSKNYAEAKQSTANYKGKTNSNTNPEYINAGVLVPVFLKEGSLHTLLTLRSEQLPTHKGQVAFPGGKQDDDDKDIVATALREAQEEVGLPPEIVEVIAVLSPVISRARDKVMYVYPVIGILKTQFDLVINNSEVQTTFDVPLELFLLQASHRRFNMTFKGRTFGVDGFDYETSEGGHLNKSLRFHIWGITASICLHVAIVALNKLPEFELAEDYSELMQYITELNVCENESKPRSSQDIIKAKF